MSIADLKIFHGKVQVREIAEVLAWADINRNMLAAKFEELQQ